MNVLFSIAIIPVATLSAIWLQLMFFDEVSQQVSPAIPVVVTLLASALSCYLKDSPKLAKVGPLFVGCCAGAILAFVWLGPTIASRGSRAELEALKVSNPGTYNFTIHSTAQIPLYESHWRRGLKIALPIGFAGGFLLGTVFALLRNTSRSTTDTKEPDSEHGCVPDFS